MPEHHPCAGGSESDSAPSDARLLVTAERETNRERDRYFYDLLQQVLDQTRDDFGVCTLEYTRNPHVRLPALAGTEGYRGVDVFWGETSREREAQLIPVRIPLTKGLTTYRLLLIRPEDQARFAGVQSLEDLARLRAGGGSGWPVSGALEAGRFDFLIRNASEVLSELETYRGMNIALEQELVLVYLAPYYFFVDANFPGLAERLSAGLKAMHASGAFDAQFFAYPTIRSALTQLRLDQRRAIVIPHPDMPDHIPYRIPEYWHFPTRGVHPWEFDDEDAGDL